jgi:hypothetical protein
MKTVKQYLQEIPDPVIRDQALQYCYQEYAGERCTDLPAAVARAFLWFQTPEKFKYWYQVYKDLGGTKQYHLVE